MIISDPEGTFKAPKFVGVRRTSGQLGKYRFDMTMSDKGMVVEWSPYPPNRLSRAQFRKYQRIRNRMAAQVANETGGSVLVVDTNGEFTVLKPTPAPATGD